MYDMDITVQKKRLQMRKRVHEKHEKQWFRLTCKQSNRWIEQFLVN